MLVFTAQEKETHGSLLWIYCWGKY